MTNQPDIFFFLFVSLFSFMVVVGSICLSILIVYFVLKFIKKRKKLKKTDDEGDH